MGFVKVPHDLMEWKWSEDKNTVYVHLNLLLRANWEEGRRKGVILRRGQLIISQQAFSEKCGISRRELRTILDRLVQTNKITKTPTAEYSLITMLEYDCETKTRTANQPTDNQQITNK